MAQGSVMADPTTYLSYKDCVRLENGAEKLRDKVAISLMFRCGLRVSEALDLKKKDIILEEDPVHSVIIATTKKKGRMAPKKRRIPVHVKLQGLLRAYTEGFREEDFIFPSPIRLGRPLTVRWAEYMLGRVASKAGVAYDKGGKKIHPHTLRHSLAIFLVLGGVKLPKIQQILGHTSLGSTTVYLQFSHKEIAEDYHAAFGGME